MSSTTREKIALLVFAVLVLLGLAALTWYLSVGKNWNVAAASIDDATGQMDGYVAILYKGTVVEDPVPEKPTDKIPETTSGKLSEETPDTTSDKPSDTTLNKVPDNTSNTKTNESTPTANKNAGTLVEKKPVTMKDVAEGYIEKDADVYQLDVTDFAKYRDGMIVRKGNQRFGVLSAALMDSGVVLQEKVDYFIEHEVDFVIVLVPNKYVVQNLKGIDVVISTNNKELATFGETVSGTFYVNTPLVDSVGVTLISPHNVVSAKVIQEL